MAGRSLPRRDGHSSGTRIAARLEQPTRTTRPGKGPSPLARKASSLFGFAPGGACHAVPVAGSAVRSYRTFSPLPATEAVGGSISVALSLGSPPPDVIRHRFSVEPGLSSTAAFRLLRQRSPSQLASAGLGICCGHVNKTLNYPKTGPCSAPVCLGANDDRD